MSDVKRETIAGRAWLFGDDIDTDQLAPGRYMKGPVEQLAVHCLEEIDPSFAKKVRPGDVVVAGNNFGIGSSREQAALALICLGVGAVVARSFGGIFLRNAFNAGLPALECRDLSAINAGDELEIDLASGILTSHTSEVVCQLDPVPQLLLDIVHAGGLIAHLKQKMAGGGGKDLNP